MAFDIEDRCRRAGCNEQQTRFVWELLDACDGNVTAAARRAGYRNTPNLPKTAMRLAMENPRVTAALSAARVEGGYPTIEGMRAGRRRVAPEDRNPIPEKSPGEIETGNVVSLRAFNERRARGFDDPARWPDRSTHQPEAANHQPVATATPWKHTDPAA